MISRRWRPLPGADDRLGRALSINRRGRNGKRVRMGHSRLCRVTQGHWCFGVAYRSDARDRLRRYFHRMFTDRSPIKPTASTFRRWLQRSIRASPRLIIETIGPRMRDHPQALRDLEGHADDPAFQRAFADQRLAGKQDFSPGFDPGPHRVSVYPTRCSTCRFKRIHEYKRQLFSTCSSRGRSTTHQGRSRWPAGCPRVKNLRGQGGGEVSACDAASSASRMFWVPGDQQ